MFWEETYIQLDPLNPCNIWATETWLNGIMHKEEGIRSAFNNHRICRADTGLALHHEDGGQTKELSL